VTADELVVAVFDALAGLRVPFMVSGSLASNFYGVPRATQDADLVLELDALPLDQLQSQLQTSFEIDRQISFETVMGSRRVVARARDASFDVELFDLTTDPHDRERFRRRRLVEVLSRSVALPTVEDVLINKLRWWQRARRRKDYDDARNVLAVQQHSLDQHYLHRWCRELGLNDLLDELRRTI
jgi:hypothetical protein